MIILSVIGFVVILCILAIMWIGIGLGGKDENVPPMLVFSVIVVGLDVWMFVSALKGMGYV